MNTNRTCPAGSFPHTIRSGDTLYKLAIANNTTVDAIMRINPGINPNNLQIGEIVCIPGGVSPPPPPTRCPAGTFEYTIRSGDTLYNLAITYKTTVEAIMRVNPGINPNNLQIGQVICIPGGATPTPPCNGVFYAVRPGDTLYSIAAMFSVPLADLMAANPGVDPNNLQVGQLICIPRVEPPPVTCPGGSLYRVLPNDNLGTILLRFNISVMDLMAGNPNLDINNISPGSQLCILPHQDRGCPCFPGTRQYTILQSDISQSGSTVVALAQKFDISVSALMRANQALSPSDFIVGKIICVPNI